VHEEFIPSKSEIEWATKVVKALDEESKSGGTRGALRLEGKMIDAVHYKQAKAILEEVNENR
jgi:citrate lyase subunit beta/citryl-CoA lyase